MDVRVFYCTEASSKWRGSMESPQSHRNDVLGNLNPRAETSDALHLNPGVIRAVLGDFDVLVVAGVNPSAALAILTCIAARRPFAIWGEMINRSGNATRRLVMGQTLHRLYRQADAIMTMGDRGRASYRAIGVPEHKILTLPYTCDLRPYFAVQREPDDSERRRVVSMAQLIARKRLDLLIRVFCRLAPEFPTWDLHLGGAGRLEHTLRALVPMDLEHRVRFLGFVPKAEQPAVYSKADLFVMTSAQDGWGMVVPEALAAGLPVISTDQVESATELLKTGGGKIISSGDAGALEASLREFMIDDALRSRSSLAARRAARSVTADEVATLAANNLMRIVGGVVR